MVPRGNINFKFTQHDALTSDGWRRGGCVFFQLFFFVYFSGSLLDCAQDALSLLVSRACAPLRVWAGCVRVCMSPS
jgi:hypothetical protein